MILFSSIWQIISISPFSVTHFSIHRRWSTKHIRSWIFSGILMSIFFISLTKTALIKIEKKQYIIPCICNHDGLAQPSDQGDGFVGWFSCYVVYFYSWQLSFPDIECEHLFYKNEMIWRTKPNIKIDNSSIYILVIDEMVCVSLTTFLNWLLIHLCQIEKSDCNWCAVV